MEKSATNAEIVGVLEMWLDSHAELNDYQSECDCELCQPTRELAGKLLGVALGST